MKPARAGAALALALGAGCTASGTIRDSVGEDSWETIAPVGLQLRLGKLDGTGKLAIARADQVIAEGPPAAGSVLPVTLAGRACEVAVLRPYSFDDTTVRREPRHVRRRAPAIVGRTYRGLEVEVRCADGPAPGSPAGQRGANPRRTMALMLVPAVLGALAGSFARTHRKGGERIGTAFLILLAAIGAAIGLAWSQLDGDFRLSFTVVGIGAAIAGLIAGRLWHRKRPHASIAWAAGAVAGPLPIVLLSPAWSYSAPIVALLCAAGAAVIASVIAVMIKPLV